MRLPIMRKAKQKRTMQNTFLGYSREMDCGEGAFVDMKNMSGKSYPAVRTRDKRSRVTTAENKIYGIMSLDIFYNGGIVKNALIADCERGLTAYFEENGMLKEHKMFQSTALTDGPKTAVVSGMFIYFFPDNVYYNFMDKSMGNLYVRKVCTLGVDSSGYLNTVKVTPSTLDGEEADETSPYRKLTRPVYKTVNGVPENEPYTYLSFSSALFEGDTVKISGFDKAELCGYFNIKRKSAKNDYLIIESTAVCSQSEGEVVVERDIPQMDYVVSSGNRLWGCRYGLDRYGNCVNEIYASALGDPKNWHRVLGVSTDSWSCTVGRSGAFTGAAVMDGVPVFFKEDAILKVFGNYPSEFTLSETCARGIEAGSAKSAVFVNDDLYYKTYSGIVRYDGGMPVNVDSALGSEKYKNAVAGTVDDRYFISMENSEGERDLFVYDTRRGIWHKEDKANITAFARAGADLYFLTDTGGENEIYCVSEKPYLISEGDLDWMCETVNMGYTTPDRKYVSSLQIRTERDKYTDIAVFVQYDRDGEWHPVYSAGKGDALLRVTPRRCDCFKLRIEGHGKCSVLSVTKTLENVSPI